MIVDGTLTLNADIDVSGRGFKGGRAYETRYPEDGPCSFSAEEGTNLPDYPDSYLYAGYKGEGAITKTAFDPNDPISNIKGYGRTWNGGGGGNGKWSGGGGGANGGNGGVGEMQSCGADGYLPELSGSVTHGNDGFAFKYKDIIPLERTLLYEKRVFMGGGGGAGTGMDGTGGGAGGGIVIIIAQNLHFEPNTAIKANGGSVEGELPLYAGAGGGGGGGSILLSVKDYGDIKAEIMGGNGGSVYRETTECDDNSENYTRGTGGGGSGGLLFTTRDTSEYRTWYKNTDRFKHTGGAEGEIKNTGRTCDHISTPGDPGVSFGDFHVQLRGFLHNYIFTPDTLVCYKVPVTIKASEPKGGTGTYTYEWQSSPNGNNNWVKIENINTPDLTYLFTEDNFYVRRMIISEDIIDISSHIKVSAYGPVNNEFAPTDTTLCWKETLVIRETIPTDGGGGEPYSYHWQVVTDHTDNFHTSTPNLTVSLRASGEQTIRRQVTSSKGCISGWSTSDIHIHPVIENNKITLIEQNICENQAGHIIGSEPTGGTGKYIYQWQVTSSSNRQITDATNTVDYNPKINNNTLIQWVSDSFHECFYQRFVQSGKCENLSDKVMVRFYREPSPSNIINSDKLGNDALKFLFSEEIYAEDPEVGSGIWTPGNEELNFNHREEPFTTVNNLQFGVNTIYWTVSNGTCVSPPDSVRIEVVDIAVTTGFSPDGDGLNDCFRIVGGENATSSEIMILDRYNNVVFESPSFKGSGDLDNCSGWWDGRNKSGNELPSGVYYYQITLNRNKVYKGYVVLKRQ